MQVSDFDFNLPSELIASYPDAQRSACRLLSLDGLNGQLQHGVFTDLCGMLNPGDLLVFNDTRVIPARLYGCKASGGKIEMLVERLLDDHHVLAHIRASKAPKPGTVLQLGDNANDKTAGETCVPGSITATVLERHDNLYTVGFADERCVLDILEQIGHIPLPPYIKRPDEQTDRERYQTVYSLHPGAVAAPTAGLHFDQPLLDALCAKGVEMAFVTLHVGAGTFQPVRATQVQQHTMHAEYAEVPASVVQAVLACKARGNKVVAVGTTSVRSLESAAQAAQPALIAPFAADTRIFIYPGYQFRVVDALITNFHLPQSTLLMLVSAFSGYYQIMHAYQQAVQEQYRFFSYGDAMYLTCNPQAVNAFPSPLAGDDGKGNVNGS